MVVVVIGVVVGVCVVVVVIGIDDDVVAVGSRLLWGCNMLLFPRMNYYFYI